jgi:hypothetical protein
MESHKQSTILYALGFIETFVEDGTKPHEGIVESDMEEARLTAENEYRAQVDAMWHVLDAGVRQLLAENGRLMNKIAMAEMALKG